MSYLLDTNIFSAKMADTSNRFLSNRNDQAINSYLALLMQDSFPHI